MRRQPWLVVALLALLGVLVLAAFPARAYLDQSRQREELAARAAAVEGANQQLRDTAARLRTDEVVERLARERYQLVRPGEEAYSILPSADAPAATAAAAAAVPVPAPRPQHWWSRAWSRVTSVF